MKQFLEVGKIVNTHGVRGEMKMQLWCDSIDFLKDFEILYLEDNGTLPVHLKSVRPQKDMALVVFNEVNSLEEAEKLKNTVVYCDRNDAKIDENAVFLQDIIGCYVVDIETEEEYGKVADVLNYGSCDIYEVKNGDKTYLIPAIDDVVKEINVEYKVVKIKAMKGIFDED